MRVHFDHQVFTNFKKGGVARYYHELITHLLAFDNVECMLHGCFVQPDNFGGYGTAKRYWKGHIPSIRGAPRVADLLNRTLLPLELRKLQDADIIHQTYYNPSGFWDSTGIPLIQTIHDLTNEKLLGMKNQKLKAVKQANHFICVSENTRRDFVDLYGVDEKCVTVVYNGFTDLRTIFAAETQPLPKPYILYVGRRNKYKNFECLLQAFARTPELRREFVILAIGDTAIEPWVRESICELGLRDEEVCFRKADDHELKSYYENAGALVYPSLYEGFGFPPLEAMALDCPVICANSSSMPEISGDAAIYFKPSDCEELAEQIRRCVFDPDLRTSLILKGRRRINSFSWMRCASETYAVYRSLA